MPADFGDFRDSSYNSMTQSAPALSIVRMLDNDHAIAGGDKGILCRGAKSGGVWTWTPVSDVAKQFIGYRVTDISRVPSQQQYAFVCTSGGSVLWTSNDGASWTNLTTSGYKGIGSWRGTDPQHTSPAMPDNLTGISFYNSQSGWVVGTRWNADCTTSNLVQKCSNLAFADAAYDLPTAVTPKGISAVDANNVWLCSSTGGWSPTAGNIWRLAYVNENWTWTSCYACSGCGVKSVKVVQSGGQFYGWAIHTDGKVLRTTDGSNWTARITTKSLSASC